MEGASRSLRRDERCRSDCHTESVADREDSGEAEGDEVVGGRAEEAGVAGVGVVEGEAGRADVAAGVSTAVMLRRL